MKWHLPNLASLLSLPAVLTLTVSASLWLSIFVYHNFALWRDPHSAYFHSKHAYDFGYSVVRQQEARAFLDQHSTSTSTSTAPPSSTTAASSNITQQQQPILCAAFATFPRDHPDAAHYFPDAVGSMLVGLSPRQRAAVDVRILFADADPISNMSSQYPWLPALVDHYASYENLSAADTAELFRLQEAHDFQRKGVLDFLYLLEECYNDTTAPYIGVFEDDIIFAGDWFARTLLALQHLTNTTDNTGTNGWLYLRLFNSETFLLWNPNKDWVFDHIWITLVLVIFSSATFLLIVRCSVHPCGRLETSTIVALSVVVIPGFTVLAFMAGKYNLPMYSLRGGGVLDYHRKLLELGGLNKNSSGVVPMDTRGCCSQALVFDRRRVPELAAYLRNRGRGQTDLMMEEYCDRPGGFLYRFAHGEQAVQHVGVVSSRGGSSNGARSVWAFYFEENTVDEIARQKASALERMDWDVFKKLTDG
ncbi:hypothetical protein B0H66DRAFT_524053 [Apodospora peruviana]|uniref:Integral membrane protein n=1 Tax=Apodospora peruviana TaxID=516989 RepID=A0AAE0HTK1_9PEZI|nr:hypothetical protein B0H66DRAFT_524053 [Apodospora peruviana]